MMRALLFALMAVSAAPALSVKLDDSLTPRQRVEVQMRWTYDIPRNRRLTFEEMNALEAHIRAYEVRLNTAPYIGRNVQIYLALPVQVQGLKGPAGMRLEWQTRGPFTAGSTQPGSRSLIYQGPVTAGVMSDVFDFTLRIDAQSVDGRLQFDPQFELEILK
jgi:hypothetical protein